MARLVATRAADDLGGHADSRAMGRHVMQNHAARADAAVFADLDIAENLRAHADEYAAMDLGMPVAGLLARAAQRHGMKHRHVVTHHGRLADDDAGRMVNEDA